MNLLSNKHFNKIGKSTLAMVLAGSVAFSSPLAFAAEETNEQDFETVDLQNLTITEANQETKEGQLEEAKTPTLVPGDFFYFMKLTLEKIKLAITFNDVKEAELLATYSAERLAEAEALFAEGKETEALETIEKALKYLDGSDEIVGEETPVEIEEEVKEDDETVEENNEVVEEEPKTTDDKAVVEVQEIISQNIIALTAAMEKVKNPTAKAALQKNMNKSYAKLAKKMAKWEEKQERKAMKKGTKVEEEVVVEDQTVNEETAPTAPITETELPVVVAPETQESAPVVESVEPAPVLPVNEVKEEAKRIKEAAKQEAKEIRNEAKQEAKQIKAEAKQSANQGKSNGKDQEKENKGN